VGIRGAGFRQHRDRALGLGVRIAIVTVTAALLAIQIAIGARWNLYLWRHS
jgi:hypothetical protein